MSDARAPAGRAGWSAGPGARRASEVRRGPAGRRPLRRPVRAAERGRAGPGPGRRHRGAAARLGRRPGGVPAAPGTRDGVRGRDDRVPRRRGRPARRRRRGRLGRPAGRGLGRAVRRRRGAARALLCAAVRETFEESGVLLAGPSADRGRRHRRAGLGGRPGRRWSGATLAGRAAGPARRWCCGPTCSGPGRTGSPRRRSSPPPVRHPLLRRRAAGRPAHPGRRRPRPTRSSGYARRTRWTSCAAASGR